MSRKAAFSRAETRAWSAEQIVQTGKEQNAVLEATITAAELYMQALSLADDPVDRRRVDSKCKELLMRAERLKSSDVSPPKSQNGAPSQDRRRPIPSRKLTTRETIIILEGSKLNGFLFKPWTAPPSSADFELKDGDSLFVDKPELPLSQCQMDSFAGWMRPNDALGRIRISQDGKLLPTSPTMGKLSMIDLVQDMTSDCSVVASLCAATSRAERGHLKILGNIVHPYDHANGTPLISPSGKYILRLYFNGCWRKVEIDDLLPTSTKSRVLHVIDRSNPGLLWPALVEKAYLKVRGGYDFPGSNSGTDLAVLTGWIPQQIFLHDEDVEPDGLWSRVHEAFKAGDLLLTMGTGKLPEREQRALGLAAEHDYAVLDMKEEMGIREMLIKNPWSDGDVWRGVARRRPNPSHESTLEMKGNEGDDRDCVVSMTLGTFWMDFGSIFQHFENMYVNWNPGLFSVREDLHFSWDLSTSSRLPGLFIDNPQFTITSGTEGEVWLLLNKHLRTGDYTHKRGDRNGYISLYIYDRNGSKVISSDGAKLRGPFVDSPNTLLVFDIPAKGTYTAVVASQDLFAEKYNFTLSTFSKMPVSLAEAASRYQHEWTVPAAWTRSTAGGNSDSTSYLTNPQFSVTARVDHKVAFVLRVVIPAEETQTDTNVKVLVMSSDGKRITRFRPRDIVAHSGNYRRGSAVVEAHLAKGNYTVICSTFDRDQYVKFRLSLHTSSQQSASLRILPSESSGRLTINSSPAVFEPETTRLLAPLTIAKITKGILILRNPRNTPSSSLFKMTLEQGQGPYKKILATSASIDSEFSNVNTGVRIEDTDLHPVMHGSGSGGLWLVLERLAQTSSEQFGDEVLQVDFLSDERIEVGPWGHGEG